MKTKVEILYRFEKVAEFSFDSIDHIKVVKAIAFNPDHPLGDMVHTQYADAPKSGRLLEVVNVNPETGEVNLYYYNADVTQVIFA